MLKRYLLILLLISLGGCCSKCQVNNRQHTSPVSQDILSTDGDSVVVRAGEMYKASNLKEVFLGGHYREVWYAPVKVEILKFDSAEGLRIHAKAGGQQTYTLELRDSTGHRFVARSIQKDPRGALSPGFKTGIVRNFVQDQISATHPYAALMVPIFAQAAGIYHPSPKLVYIPDTPELGDLQQYFGGVLALLEEDADENWENNPQFGSTPNAVSTETMLEHVNESHDHTIDAKAFLKARLFDMWLNDWDRHEGQWRWASIPSDTGTLYRPIPEDRDNMMFRTDGLIPWIASRKWAARKFQDFKDVKVRDIKGLNKNGRPLDERILGELGRETWLKIARELQADLTDEVIAQGIHAMPDTIVAISGQEIDTTLKQRRHYLPDYAERYYELLAQEVQVHGTAKKETFLLTSKDRDRLEVKVLAPDEKELYHRLFDNSETKVVILHPHSTDDAVIRPKKSRITIEQVSPEEEDGISED